MKAAAFSYTRPDSLAQTLAQYGVGVAGGASISDSSVAPRPDVRLMAGGQSLGPMLNLRLAEPALVVDIRRLPELRGHRVDDGRLIIGAALTHAEIEDGVVPDTTRGMLPAVARNIAYRAVRNRGTIGGSLAHADPAADWVNSLVALQARLHVHGPSGTRVVEAHDFVLGAYQTALTAGELLTAVELPAFSAQMRWGYYKICTKVGEFASAIGAVVLDPVLNIRSLVIGAVEARPLLVPELAAHISEPYDAARDAIARHLEASMPAASDVFVHQHAVALARAFAQMNSRQPMAE